MSAEQKAIFDKATIDANFHLEKASAANMGVDMARYPHMQEAAQAVTNAIRIVYDNHNVAAVEHPITVVIHDDNREWDDPLIVVVDAIGCDTAEDLRGLVVSHYDDLFNSDDCVSAGKYWVDSGAVIQAVIPGAVQIGWQVGGVDNHTLTACMKGFEEGM